MVPKEKINHNEKRDIVKVDLLEQSNHGNEDGATRLPYDARCSQQTLLLI